MASSKHRFSAVLRKDDRTQATPLPIPLDVEKLFGIRGRVPVRGTLNGVPFRSTLSPFGGVHYLPVNRALREQAGVAAGDRVEVVLEHDAEQRVVSAPADLARALKANKQAADAWERLSYSHKRAYAEAIAEAKKAETRERRIRGAVAELSRTRPRT
jgi:hypothetical protein